MGCDVERGKEQRNHKTSMVSTEQIVKQEMCSEMT